MMKVQMFIVLCVIAPIFGAPIGDPEDFKIRELSQEEKDFVWHCYRYHQLGVTENMIPYQPCRYLSFDRPTELLLSPNETIFNMIIYWSHLEGETYRQLAYLAMERINETRAMDCMLREKGKSGPLCKIVTDSRVNIFSFPEYSLAHQESLATMRMLYMDESVRSRVEDCYTNHRKDYWIGCHLISWGGDSDKPIFEDHLRIWEKLEAKHGRTGEKMWYDIGQEFEGDF